MHLVRGGSWFGRAPLYTQLLRLGFSQAQGDAGKLATCRSDPCATVHSTMQYCTWGISGIARPVARARWNFPCCDWNKSPNSDMGENWGLLTSGSEQPPTWPDGSLPRGPGSSVSHCTQESRACPTLCRIQVPGLSSGRLLRSTKTSLLNFRGVLRHLLDVVSVSRNGPGKWSSRQYFAPRASLLSFGTGRSNLELQQSQQGQLNRTQESPD